MQEIFQDVDFDAVSGCLESITELSFLNAAATRSISFQLYNYLI